MTPEEEEVSEANRALYAAFEARDLTAMAEVWERVATNVSVRRDGRWRLVVHHGSPVG